MAVPALLEAWLQATAQFHPLLENPDEFRNPVGHAMREALAVVLDVVLGRLPAADAAAPLERLIRIRAVQDLTPAQAIGFLFALKPLLPGCDAASAERIDRLALMAFDLYVNCREQAHAIQIKELRRRTYLLDRLPVERSCREAEA